jgi:hypothetical protein
MRESGIVFSFVFILMIIYKPAKAQRFFVTSTGEVSRTYRLSHAYADAQVANAPLILWLFSDGRSLQALPVQDSVWKGLNRPVVMLLPSPAKEAWTCHDEAKLSDNVDFLQTILGEVYDNFHIDRNRVYIISDVASKCLADSFVSRFPMQVVSTRTIAAMDISLKEMMTLANQVLEIEPVATPRYKKWENPLYNAEVRRMEVEDSIRRVRWARRVSVEFRTGGFYLLPGVRTKKDKTYMDISDARSVLDIHMTSWMNDSMAWFVDIGWIKVPQKQEMDGVRIEAGGGMILPVTVGFRYAFHRRKTRPYILLGTGPIAVLVFGGRFGTNIDPNYIKNKIKAEARMAFQTTLGTGIDCRLGKRILTGIHIRYIHSSEFESAGAVKAIRGFTGSISVGYILGANRLKLRKE